MKVALLFFGQLRFIDNPHTVDSHHQMIIDRYDTDIFAHCWWSEGEQYHTSGFHQQSPLLLNTVDNALDKFKSKYDITKLSCEPSRLFKDQADAMLERVNTRSWEISKPYWFHRENVMSNTFSHMYSIQKAADLLLEHIEETGTQYDFIILSRPDALIYGSPDLNTLDPNCFYLSNHHNNFPDLQYIFGQKFINFLRLYDHISTINDEDLFGLHDPTPENFKASTYRKYFDRSDLRPIHLPIRIVRGDDCNGLQW